MTLRVKRSQNPGGSRCLDDRNLHVYISNLGDLECVVRRPGRPLGHEDRSNRGGLHCSSKYTFHQIPERVDLVQDEASSPSPRRQWPPTSL